MDGGLDLAAVRRVHLVGIGGAGMSGLAHLFLLQGKRVSGSDARAGPMLAALAARGASVHAGHAAEHVGDAELVVVTAAVAPDNPEVQRARERGVPVVTHADVLGLLTAHARAVAIAGTHGKTTTTALVGFLLERAGRDPTILAGAEMLNYGASVRLGRGPHVVVEADEYDRRFLRLAPRVAVVTSVEPDHLDYYHGLAEIREAFTAFVGRLPADGVLVACDDDPVARALPTYARRVGYGLASVSGWCATDCVPCPPQGTRFVAIAPDGQRAPVMLPLVGRHNVANALAALAVVVGESVPLAEAAQALASFQGTQRRFERVGAAAGILVVDDYAHHPTAIAATIGAARTVHPGPLWVVFQPHTRNRTARLLDEFAAALAMADVVIVTAIYEPVGREREPLAISGTDLAARVKGPPTRYFADLESVVDHLAASLPTGALLLTMGAGDVDRVASRVLARLTRERE